MSDNILWNCFYSATPLPFHSICNTFGKSDSVEILLLVGVLGEQLHLPVWFDTKNIESTSCLLVEPINCIRNIGSTGSQHYYY